MNNMYQMVSLDGEISLKKKFSKIKKENNIFFLIHVTRCFFCRSSADHYCLENRVPICSIECKKKI